MAVFFRSDFQAAAASNAFLAARPANGLTAIRADVTQASGIGVWWDYSWVSSGGYSNRAYLNYTWIGSGAGASGGWGVDNGIFGTTGVDGTNVWPDTFYCRWRMKFINGIQNAGNIVRTFKWLLAGGGVSSGDRVLICLEPATSRGGSDNTTHVALTMFRNLENAQTASVLIEVGDWHHIQVMWKHGNAATAQFKIWVDNDVEGSPDATSATFDGDWLLVQNAYNNGALQYYQNTSPANNMSPAFNHHSMDLEIGDAFLAWAGDAPGLPDPGIRGTAPVMIAGFL